MGGPSSSVIFSTTSSPFDWAEIENIISGISENVEGEGFWVTSTTSINGTVLHTNGRPFGIEKSEIDADYSKEVISTIKNVIECTPTISLDIYAMCNSPVDHKILGELSYYLAEKFHGIIDFGGAIYSYQSLPSKMKEGMWLWEEAHWKDIKPYFDEMVEKIDGNIFTIEYETANHKNWAHHLCDAEFMKNWLQHDSFGMIK